MAGSTGRGSAKRSGNRLREKSVAAENSQAGHRSSTVFSAAAIRDDAQVGRRRCARRSRPVRRCGGRALITRRTTRLLPRRGAARSPAPSADAGRLCSALFTLNMNYSPARTDPDAQRRRGLCGQKLPRADRLRRPRRRPADLDLVRHRARRRQGGDRNHVPHPQRESRAPGSGDGRPPGGADRREGGWWARERERFGTTKGRPPATSGDQEPDRRRPPTGRAVDQAAATYGAAGRVRGLQRPGGTGVRLQQGLRNRGFSWRCGESRGHRLTPV